MLHAKTKSIVIVLVLLFMDVTSVFADQDCDRLLAKWSRIDMTHAQRAEKYDMSIREDNYIRRHGNTNGEPRTYKGIGSVSQEMLADFHAQRAEVIREVFKYVMMNFENSYRLPEARDKKYQLKDYFERLEREEKYGGMKGNRRYEELVNVIENYINKLHRQGILSERSETKLLDVVRYVEGDAREYVRKKYGM